MDMDSLLKEMKERDASDLHLVVGTSPTFRTDGDLKKLDEEILTDKETTSLIYSFTDEKQRAEFEKTHELDFSFAKPGLGRFRANLHVQRGSIAAAIRHIPDRIPSLSELNLPPILAELALEEKGLVLVTGPTGCGKSTTLAAMIEVINEQRPAHVITIEDPIEYLHSHKKSVVEQREVGSDTFSFAASLKRCLRQDPDVIMIGEMRDLETIATAITAAETGHLVLATLHTPNAPEAVNRIVDVFPSYQQTQIRMQLSSTLQGIIAQVLLPRNDTQGRVPVVELLIATPAVRNLIRTGKSHQLWTSMETGSQFGMQTMDQALKDLINRGTVGFEVAVAKAKDRATFEKDFGLRF